MINDIAKHFNIASCTVLDYLSRGNELNWTNYYPGEARELLKGKRYIKTKHVKVVELNKIFKSANEAVEYIKSKYGLQLNANNIRRVCSGERFSHRGYHFEYVKEEEYAS